MNLETPVSDQSFFRVALQNLLIFITNNNNNNNFHCGFSFVGVMFFLPHFYVFTIIKSKNQLKLLDIKLHRVFLKMMGCVFCSNSIIFQYCRKNKLKLRTSKGLINKCGSFFQNYKDKQNICLFVCSFVRLAIEQI